MFTAKYVSYQMRESSLLELPRCRTTTFGHGRISYIGNWLTTYPMILNKWQILQILTHWGRVTYKCVSKLIIIGSGNGLSPGQRQAIIWTNAGILLIGPLGTNFSEILIEICTFSFKKMHLKMSSGKWRPSCLGLHVLRWFTNLDRDRSYLPLWLLFMSPNLMLSTNQKFCLFHI